MQIGFIGLGKMGSRMVQKLLSEQHYVVAWNRSLEPAQELKSQISNIKNASQNLKIATSVEDLVRKLNKPRTIWSMLPAGDATQNVLAELSTFVENDAIIIDGGNAYYKDTERHYQELKAKKIRFLGIGVSGGLLAFENGYPLMVGGDESAYEFVLPILDSLSKPHGGYEYFGRGGAGHFVKMIHNGIEYGMMQSFGEGFGVLQKSKYQLDLLKIAKLWQKGTIVSSFLLDRAVDALSKNKTLDDIDGIIAESGEAEWTVEQAKKEDVPIEIIEKSLEFRRRSQTDPEVQKSFAARLVAVLRREFGGHEVKEK